MTVTTGGRLSKVFLAVFLLVDSVCHFGRYILGGKAEFSATMLIVSASSRWLIDTITPRFIHVAITLFTGTSIMAARSLAVTNSVILSTRLSAISACWASRSREAFASRFSLRHLAPFFRFFVFCGKASQGLLLPASVRLLPLTPRGLRDVCCGFLPYSAGGGFRHFRGCCCCLLRCRRDGCFRHCRYYRLRCRCCAGRGCRLTGLPFRCRLFLLPVMRRRFLRSASADDAPGARDGLHGVRRGSFLGPGVLVESLEVDFAHDVERGCWCGALDSEYFFFGDLGGWGCSGSYGSFGSFGSGCCLSVAGSFGGLFWSFFGSYGRFGSFGSGFWEPWVWELPQLWERVWELPLS